MSIKISPPPFLSYAFRPLFACAGIFALLGMLQWMLAWHGWSWPAGRLFTVAWHAHEMAVGFGGAVVGGFLLTAVATWTGRQPVRGLALLTLVLTWLSGRAAMLFTGAAFNGLTAGIDLAYPALLALLVTREVTAAGNRRNYGVAVLVSVLFLLDGLYHFGTGAGEPGLTDLAPRLMVQLLAVLVAVIGGRVVPNFTANWLRGRGSTLVPVSRLPVERVIIPVTVAAALALSLAPASAWTGAVCVAAGILHGLRVAGWRGLATRSEPLLFVLHLAYAWLAFSYLFLGAVAFGLPAPAGAAMHALTVGAIASMVLAMMTRVALGHTGRPLHAARVTVAAYLALGAAAVLRSVGVGLAPASGALLLSALAWMAAFGLFLVAYLPMLIGPKADPGA